MAKDPKQLIPGYQSVFGGAARPKSVYNAVLARYPFPFNELHVLFFVSADIAFITLTFAVSDGSKNKWALGTRFNTSFQLERIQAPFGESKPI